MTLVVSTERVLNLLEQESMMPEGRLRHSGAVRTAHHTIAATMSSYM